MKIKKPNAEQVWKEFEDVVPRLRLSMTDRVLYSHLLRHSRLEGRLRLHFSILRLARSSGLSHTAVRESVRRLIVRGVLRLLERNKTGHLVEVRLPGEVRFAPAVREPSGPRCRVRDDSFFERNFLRCPALRRSIHAREGGRCFYCRTRLTVVNRCLDHVIPRVETEDNSFRNLVSCCRPCNSLKSDSPAATFLRRLHLDGRLTDAELTARLRALDAVVAGKLRPLIPPQPPARSRPV
jgi:5-methylcytosine-specific restriction endonuclease McrA